MPQLQHLHGMDSRNWRPTDGKRVVDNCAPSKREMAAKVHALQWRLDQESDSRQRMLRLSGGHGEPTHFGPRAGVPVYQQANAISRNVQAQNYRNDHWPKPMNVGTVLDVAAAHTERLHGRLAGEVHNREALILQQRSLAMAQARRLAAHPPPPAAHNPHRDAEIYFDRIRSRQRDAIANTRACGASACEGSMHADLICNFNSSLADRVQSALDAEKADAVAEINCRLDALSEVPAVPSKASGGLKFRPDEVGADQMDRYLEGLFKIADTNGDGVLQPSELATLLQLTGFNLSASTILDIVQAADVDGDGVIQYAEFVPVVRELLTAPAKSEEGAASNLKYQELTTLQLEEYLRELFKIADMNGDGVLQPVEYVQLMRLSGLNFSDEVVLAGLTDADTNKDGVIDYEELVAYFKKALVVNGVVEQL